MAGRRAGCASSDWPAFRAALTALHHPADPMRSRRKRRRGRGSPMTNCSPASLRSRWCARTRSAWPGGRARRRAACARRSIAALPYSLTPSQARAIDEINADLAKPERMLRLLQGDVGSGKTVVALLAAATVVEAGRQAALMAPTEILARQHLKTIAPLAEAAGLRVAILTGRERGSERARHSGAARGRRARSPGRHACAVPGGGRIPRSRARRRRRAASLRRAPAPGAAAQGRGRRRAGADRDADPAHAGADLFRRHGRLAAAREARRPPADRHARRAARPASTRSSAAVGRALDAASRSTGSARWSPSPRMSDLAAAEQRFAELKQHFGDVVDLVHGQHEGRRQGRRHGALSPPARRDSWSPPR